MNCGRPRLDTVVGHLGEEEVRGLVMSGCADSRPSPVGLRVPEAEDISFVSQIKAPEVMSSRPFGEPWRPGLCDSEDTSEAMFAALTDHCY